MRELEKLHIGKKMLLILALLGLLYYSTSWKSYFVSDDYRYIGRIHLSDFLSYFTKSWGYGNEYRPLLPLSYAVDASITHESPVGFHITNTLLHLSIAALAGMTFYAFGIPSVICLLASALFFLNPVAHESVLWISGRPVLLGAFFMMLSVWAFAKYSHAGSKIWYPASLSFFMLALISYEGASSLPFIVGILILSRSSFNWKSMRVMAPYFLLLAVYVIFWNFLFEGKITRFPVESTLPGFFRSFSALLKRVFYGSSHGIPLAFYLVIFLSFLFLSKKGKLCLTVLALMIAGYLPFFIVRGYADRFAYISSIPAMLLLAWMILSFQLQRFRAFIPVALTCVLVAYYGFSMQTRIYEWRKAGDIARQIPIEIKKLHPDLPREALIYVDGVPEMYKNAYVFITGLEPAIQRVYGWAPIRVRMNARPASSNENALFFQYSNGAIRELARS
jgi:hypothetical protein